MSSDCFRVVSKLVDGDEVELVVDLSSSWWMRVAVLGAGMIGLIRCHLVYASFKCLVVSYRIESDNNRNTVLRCMKAEIELRGHGEGFPLAETKICRWTC